MRALLRLLSREVQEKIMAAMGLDYCHLTRIVLLMLQVLLKQDSGSHIWVAAVLHVDRGSRKMMAALGLSIDVSRVMSC
jgi:hypothetical protein